MGVTKARIRTVGAIQAVPSNTIVQGTRKVEYGTNRFVETIRYPYTHWIGGRSVCSDFVNPGPPYKSGGDLTILKTELGDWRQQANRFYTYDTMLSGVRYKWTYKGGFLPIWPQAPYPFSVYDLQTAGRSGYFSSSYGDPSSLGATAYNNYKPKQSTAGLGVFLGELREAPRMLSTSAGGFADVWRSAGGSATSKGMYPKKVADHYLNTQFGWLPFLSDLRAFIKTQQEAEKRLRQLSRDNGRWIRREGLVGSDTVETVLASLNTNGEKTPYFWPVPYEQMMQPCGSGKLYECKVVNHIVTRSWFCGSFRYYVPALVRPNTGLNKLQNYLRLYGARINPSLIWNLTPWTWLLDWNANLGDIVSNWCDKSDNLVSRYAYIMQHKEQYLVNSSRMNFKRHGVVSLAWRRGCTSKQRRSADPFGFAVDVGDYSDRQLAILSALGLANYKVRP